MHKFMAVVTVLVTVITAILGMASFLGSESAGKYHLAAGFLTLFLVLLATHQLYHGTTGRK